MNCRNSAQNALKVAIFRLKIEKFSGEGALTLLRPLPHWAGGYPIPKLHPPRRFRRLDPRAFGARPWPPFANPGSATVHTV